MQEVQTIKADIRNTFGKNESRRLRKSGKIPAITYGKGHETRAIAVTPGDVLGVLRSDHGKNSVLKLDVPGASDVTVMIRDYTYHPVTRSLEHVDFVEVKLDKPIDVEVPLSSSGKAAGVAAGGLLRQVFRTLPLRCRPDLIPSRVTVDVTALELGGAFTAGQLALAEGITCRLPAEQTILAVVAPEKEKAEAVADAPAAAAAPAAAKKEEPKKK